HDDRMAQPSTAVNSTGIEAQRKHAKQQLDTARKNAFNRLQNSINFPQLVASQGFANVSSFVFHHNIADGFNIELNLNVDNTDVTLVASSHGERLLIDILGDEGSLLTHATSRMEQILDKILSLKVELVSPSSVPLVPAERSLPWPQIKQRVDAGREF